MGFLAPFAPVIGAVGGALLNNSSSRSQERAITQSNDAAIAEQRRQYDLSRQDMQPWLGAGTNALRQMQIELGLPVNTAPPVVGTETNTGGAAAGVNNLYGDGFMSIPGLAGRFRIPTKTQPTFGNVGGVTSTPAPAPTSAGGSGFRATPGYEFVRSEGMRGLERSAAARGGAFSGNALRGLDQFNNGLASQEYNNYYNRLAGLSGTGQNTGQNLAGLGANMAGNVGNLLTNSGQARASAAAQRYSGLNNLFNFGVGMIPGMGR